MTFNVHILTANFGKVKHTLLRINGKPEIEGGWRKPCPPPAQASWGDTPL